MLGSNASVSNPNVVLNTAVAEELKEFADELEGAENFEAAIHDLIQKVIREHKRIIFNGNGYDEAWLVEAEKRGLLNLRTTPDAWSRFLDPKNVALFTTHKVLSETEMHSRYEINMENYCKVLNIEATTMADMARKDILPAVSSYGAALAENALSKKSVSGKADCSYEEELTEEISALTGRLYQEVKALETAEAEAKAISDVGAQAMDYKDKVLPAMADLRKTADTLETITAAEYWPYPSYGDILFSVR